MDLVEFHKTLWYPRDITRDPIGSGPEVKMWKLAIVAVACVASFCLAVPMARAQDESGAEEELSPSGEGAEEAAEPEEGVQGPGTELECDNGVDDDEDGDVDCNDYDCLDAEECYQEEDVGEEDTPTPDIELETDEGDDEELIEVPDDEEEEDDGDWDDRPVDMFELHGYLRVRGDLFHKLHIARLNSGHVSYWSSGFPGSNYYPPRPYDNITVDCADEEGCSFGNNTFAGANMRFRFEPIINLGDRVRILAQIDLLDNMVLGSTPEGHYFEPSGVGGRSPWIPLRAFSSTQVAPSSRNSLAEAISVRRVWAEVMTPFGQLQFGRMGSHWGLGMLANSGNELDSDWGDNVDRIMLATRLWGMLLVPGVEFVGSGTTTQLWSDIQGGQAMDAAQMDDIMQYFLVIARRLPREEQEERMRRGDLVVNGGLYFVFRNQVLSQEYVAADSADSSEHSEMTLRNAWAVIPDLWFQLYYRGFHLEFELAYIGGSIENTEDESYDASSATDIHQIGGAIRADYTMMNGQLNFGLEFGYASGDAEFEGLTPRQARGTMTQAPGYPGSGMAGSDVNSLFRFDPDFNVDLILFEQILGQVAGAYYFRPWVQYEFIRGTVGIRGDVIYALASEPLSTIGNSPHLGIEIDIALWYRAAPPHNFVAMLQYGVLFPLSAWHDPFHPSDGFAGVEYPQTLQLLLAVPY